MDTEIVRQIWQSTWQAQAVPIVTSPGLTPERIDQLRELFLLIGAHWLSEGGRDTLPHLDIREDSRRQRLVLTLQTPTPLTSQTKETLSPLQKARSHYLLALAQALEGSCVEMITQGVLQGYTIILPLEKQKSDLAEASVAQEPREHSPPQAPTLTVVDSDDSKERKKARKREQLRQFFIESLPQDTSSLEQARTQGDWEAVRRIAHQLKGCAASFGFPEITEQAMVLDDLIKSEQAANYQEACDTLLNTLRKVV
jgi:HPt (histidine-containing phosphotransfer) domain-containing protein